MGNAFARLVPRPRSMRLVLNRIEGSTDDIASLVERLQLAERQRLYEQISHSRRLRRPGENGHSRHVRGHLTQELVARTAAHDVNHGRGDPCGRAEQIDRVAMLEREALENATNNCARILRLRLASGRAEGANALRHVAGCGKDRIVDVDSNVERLVA